MRVVETELGQPLSCQRKTRQCSVTQASCLHVILDFGLRILDFRNLVNTHVHVNGFPAFEFHSLSLRPATALGNSCRQDACATLVRRCLAGSPQTLRR